MYEITYLQHLLKNSSMDQSKVRISLVYIYVCYFKALHSNQSESNIESENTKVTMKRADIEAEFNRQKHV